MADNPNDPKNPPPGAPPPGMPQVPPGYPPPGYPPWPGYPPQGAPPPTASPQQPPPPYGYPPPGYPGYPPPYGYPPPGYPGYPPPYGYPYPPQGQPPMPQAPMPPQGMPQAPMPQAPMPQAPLPQGVAAHNLGRRSGYRFAERELPLGSRVEVLEAPPAAPELPPPARLDPDQREMRRAVEKKNGDDRSFSPVTYGASESVRWFMFSPFETFLEEVVRDKLPTLE